MLHFIIISLIIVLAIRYAAWIILFAVLYVVGWLVIHMSLMIALLAIVFTSDYRNVIGFGIIFAVGALLIWLPKKYPILLKKL